MGLSYITGLVKYFGYYLEIIRISTDVLSSQHIYLSPLMHKKIVLNVMSRIV